MKPKRWILAIFVAFGVVRFCSALESEAEMDMAALETRMANRIEPIAKQIAGVSKAWVWVHVEPDLERWKAFVKTLTPAASRAVRAPAASQPSPDILPGVNADEMVGLLKRREQASAKPAAAPRSRGPDFESAIKMASWFPRISVRIAVPDSVDPKRLQDLKDKLPGLVGLRLNQGDTLFVETVPDTAPPTPAAPPKTAKARILEWLDQITPGMLTLWLGLFVLMIFIFGPVRAFLRDLAGALQTIRVQSQTANKVDTRTESVSTPLAELKEGEEPQGNPPKSLPSPTSEKARHPLFDFITDEMMPNLMQACRQELPERIAMLVNYLKPAQAAQLMASLSPAQRAIILSHFTGESQFKPEDVKAFSEHLKNTLAFVSGGPDRLLKLIEEADPTTRQSLLEELDQSYPETSQAVRAKLLTPLDLFRLPPKDLQKLLWETHRHQIGLAFLISAVPPKGQDYLLKQLPDTIAHALRSEIQALGTPPMEQLENESRRFVQLARTLEKNGDIAPVLKKAV